MAGRASATADARVDPAIHVLHCRQDVDARHKAGHDGDSIRMRRALSDGTRAAPSGALRPALEERPPRHARRLAAEGGHGSCRNSLWMKFTNALDLLAFS
jgi:hypothetical protein